MSQVHVSAKAISEQHFFIVHLILNLVEYHCFSNSTNIHLIPLSQREAVYTHAIYHTPVSSFPAFNTQIVGEQGSSIPRMADRGKKEQSKDNTNWELLLKKGL